MTRVLVTGASGLIGRELVPALRAAGHDVVTTGRADAGTDLPGYDLSVPETADALLAQVHPATVVHLAGGTATSRHELYRRNVLTTVHVLEAVARQETSAYCLVLGSAAEYGDGSGEPAGEGSPLAPVSEYGRAKVAQTTLAEAIARRRGVPLTVMRPFNVVAPSLPSNSALGNLRRQLLATADREPVVTCGRLDVVRDYVSLSAVVEAVQRLLVSPRPRRTLNVCSGVGLELGAILEAMAAELGVEPHLVTDAALAALPAAARVIGDPSAMRAELGLAVPMDARRVARLVLDR